MIVWICTDMEITIEWAWSGMADVRAVLPGVERVNARTTRWRLDDVRDVYRYN